MKKAGMVMLSVLLLAGAVLARPMKGSRGPQLPADVFIEDPYKLAVENILDAIAEKELALALVDQALEQETQAVQALISMIRSRDFRDLKPRDILRAAAQIYVSAAKQQNCRRDLINSIEHLERSLGLLGWVLPVSYWRLDEGEGDTAYDSVGTNDGTLVNANWVEGVIGTGLYFPGNSYLNVPDADATFDFGASEDFSISLWFNVGKRTGSRAQELISKRDSRNPNRGFKVYYEDRYDNPNYTKVVFAIDVDAWYPVVCQTDVGDSEWHHLVALRRGDRMELYIDGQLEDWAQNTEIAGDITNPEPLRMGMDCTGSTKDYYGSLDEVGIYRAAVSPKQVEIMYTRDLGL